MSGLLENLMTPEAAQTEDSVALLWDKPAEKAAEYEIYVDGALAGTTGATDYTVSGLESGREYAFWVCALNEKKERFLESAVLWAATRKTAERVDVTAYGAVGDGKTKNTESLQTAINACPAGGMVVIPKGVYLSGALFLKSDMTLYLEEGAVLLGSLDPSDYPVMEYRWEGREHLCYASLLNTKPVDSGQATNETKFDETRFDETLFHDITIMGAGQIDGNGERLRVRELEEKKGVRGRTLALWNVERLYLKDVTVKQAPAWCVHLMYCKDVAVNQVKVYTKFDENGKPYHDMINGDGIDPDSCKNVAIFHSLIASADDCIAIKSGRDEEGRAVGIPTENVRVTNCRFLSGFGVAVGSEMSGGVRNVLVQDCEFTDVYSVGSVKAPRGRGAVVENICYEDIRFVNGSEEHKDCRWFRGAIYIDQFYSHEDFDTDMPEEVNEGTSILRNITFRNIELETVAGNAVYLTGLPEQPLENIRLENIRAVGKFGMKANNVQGLSMENVRVTAKEGEDFQYHNVILT